MEKIRKNNIYIILIIFIVIIVFGYLVFSRQDKEEPETETETETETEAETETETPNKGEQSFEVLNQEDVNDLNEEEKEENIEGSVQNFKVSSAKGVYPKFISGRIIPAKPIKDMDQEIFIKIEDPVGIKEVSLEIKDEYGKNLLDEFEMEIFEGDSFRGEWRAVWQPHDFEDVIRWVFKVENNEGETDDLTYFSPAK